jgi:formylglycine-generating enzyme required for sulfatase activity
VEQTKVRRQPVNNETKKPDGEKRVLRGGCWYGDARNVRSANRNWYELGYRYDSIGFRLVSGADKSEEATCE